MNSTLKRIVILTLIAAPVFGQHARFSNYRYKADGMVGFYPFEDGSTDDLLTSSTGTFYGDAYIGEVSGSDTAGGAIFYDGTGDYTLFTTAQAHRDATTGHELTWFSRFRKTDGADNFFMMRWYNSSPLVSRYLRSHPSAIYLAYIYASGLDYSPVQSGETDEHTFSCTHSEPDSNLLQYLDGAWINTMWTSTATFRTDSGETQISGAYSTSHSWLDGEGWLSEFRLYDYALTASQILRLTQEGDHR